MISKKEVSIVILVIVIIVAVFGYVYFSSQKGGNQENDSPEDIQKTVTETGVEIPLSVRSYTGVIKDVTPDGIRILVESHNNLIAQDQLLFAAVDERTEYVHVVLPKDIPLDETGITSEETTIVLADLFVGDIVEVYSESNIAGKTTFLVKRIRVFK